MAAFNSYLKLPEGICWDATNHSESLAMNLKDCTRLCTMTRGQLKMGYTKTCTFVHTSGVRYEILEFSACRILSTYPISHQQAIMDLADFPPFTYWLLTSGDLFINPAMNPNQSEEEQLYILVYICCFYSPSILAQFNSSSIA